MSELFGDFHCRLSTSLIEAIEEHTREAEVADGWNEFVECALRRSLREGWDARHQNASFAVAARHRRNDREMDALALALLGDGPRQ